jgi:hypothetical protein
MILGLSTATFTSVHVALSLIGIVSGVIVLYCMVRATRLDGWTALFLATTVLTSVTAFFFPSTSFGPAHAVGVLSLVVLAAAIAALYFFRLAGPWRWIYVVGAVLALYSTSSSPSCRRSRSCRRWRRWHQRNRNLRS